jgi:hypothetical protein
MTLAEPVAGQIDVPAGRDLATAEGRAAQISPVNQAICRICRTIAGIWRIGISVVDQSVRSLQQTLTAIDPFSGLG